MVLHFLSSVSVFFLVYFYHICRSLFKVVIYIYKWRNGKSNFSWFKSFLFSNILYSSSCFFRAFYNKHFQINLESVVFVFNKLKHDYFGITLDNLQFSRNFIPSPCFMTFGGRSSSVQGFMTFGGRSSNVQGCEILKLSYFCTVSYMALSIFCALTSG